MRDSYARSAIKEAFKMKDKRRHIILINKNFQFGLIAKFICVNIFIMLLFGLFLYVFFNSEIDSNLRSAHVAYKNIKDMMFPIILTLSLLNIFISSIIIGIFVMYASHRLAGPLYRFNAALTDISNRKLNTVTSIREGDEYYECVNSLKSVTGILKEDISAIQKIVKDLKIDDNNKHRENMKKKIDALDEIVSRYEL